MQIIVPQDDSVARWVLSRIGDGEIPKPGSRAVGVSRDGRLIAGAIYTDMEYRNADVAFASTGPGWATRRTLAALLCPPFREMDCQRITARIRKSNKASRKLVEKIGFKLEGTIWKGFGTEDMMIYGLRPREAARWLEAYT